MVMARAGISAKVIAKAMILVTTMVIISLLF